MFVQINCKGFDFHSFPMDVQTCDLVFHGDQTIQTMNITGTFEAGLALDLENIHLQYDITMVNTSEAKKERYRKWYPTYLSKTLVLKRLLSPYTRYTRACQCTHLN